MIDVLYSYVTVFCGWHTVIQDLLTRSPEIKLIFDLLVSAYVVPTFLALAFLARWFEGETAVERTSNQQGVLHGLAAAALSWGLVALIGVACEQVLSAPEWGRVLAEWACWQGPPSPSVSAAIGFALGTTLWRREWRWGVRYFVVTGLWVGVQTCRGIYYPMDGIVGAALGSGIAWLLGSVGWMNRPVGTLIRLARRWMLA